MNCWYDSLRTSMAEEKYVLRQFSVPVKPTSITSQRGPVRFTPKDGVSSQTRAIFSTISKSRLLLTFQHNMRFIRTPNSLRPQGI